MFVFLLYTLFSPACFCSGCLDDVRFSQFILLSLVLLFRYVFISLFRLLRVFGQGFGFPPVSLSEVSSVPQYQGSSREKRSFTTSIQVLKVDCEVLDCEGTLCTHLSRTLELSSSNTLHSGRNPSLPSIDYSGRRYEN
jgi:hypothetical protein